MLFTKYGWKLYALYQDLNKVKMNQIKWAQWIQKYDSRHLDLKKYGTSMFFFRR